MDKCELKMSMDPVLGGLSHLWEFYVQKVYQVLTVKTRKFPPDPGRKKKNVAIVKDDQTILLFSTSPCFERNNFIRA